MVLVFRVAESALYSGWWGLPIESPGCYRAVANLRLMSDNIGTLMSFNRFIHSNYSDGANFHVSLYTAWLLHRLFL